MTRVLVVDDVADSRGAFASLLTANGYDVVTASDGGEALALAQGLAPDLVVSGLFMPVMDGFELCRRWKADERLKAVPFIFCTGTGVAPEDERRALGLGAERLLVKPPKAEVLLRAVREVLEEVRRGPPASPSLPLGEEMEELRRYNETLFRKLEKMVLQLQDTQARLQEAHRLAHLGVWSLDPADGTVTWSEELYRIHGLDPKQPAPSVAELARLFTPESWEVLQSAIRGTLSTAEPHDVELELVRPDGARRWLNTRASVRRDGSGRVVGLHGMAQDVTERKRGDVERARLTAAIEQTGEIVYVTAIDGTLQYVNPTFETVTGFSRAEALGQNPRFLRSGLQDAPFYQGLWQTIGSGRPWRGRMVNRRKDGTSYTQDMTISPVCDAGGRIVNFVAVARDITEQLRLEAQVQASQKMDAIGRLAGGVAHDFNNLLSVILNYTEFALEGVREGDPLRDDLQEVLKAGGRAAALTRQLLAFSRKQLLEPQVLDLNQIVADLEKMLRRLIGEHLQLESALAPDLWPVKADPGQLEQVLMNLVLNARDAMPEGGKVTIETANVELDAVFTAQHGGLTAGSYVLMAVSDTGSGMDAATVQRVFEPFFTTKERGKGTGLGLSTVYGIVKQSGGDILAFSEPGKGSSFKVYLPRLADGSEVAPERRAPLAPAVGTETILVVEDEEALRKVAARILSAAGYQVLAAANGGEALLTCEQHGGAIDLLLTDIVMPLMGGRQLAERLQALRPDLRVLFMSGYTDNAIVQHGVLAPGMRFICKPFSAAALTRKVRDALDEGRP